MYICALQVHLPATDGNFPPPHAQQFMHVAVAGTGSTSSVNATTAKQQASVREKAHLKRTLSTIAPCQSGGGAQMGGWSCRDLVESHNYGEGLGTKSTICISVTPMALGGFELVALWMAIPSSCVMMTNTTQPDGRQSQKGGCV